MQLLRGLSPACGDKEEEEDPVKMTEKGQEGKEPGNGGDTEAD